MKDAIQKLNSPDVLCNSCSEKFGIFTGKHRAGDVEVFRKALLLEIYNKFMFLINTTA